MKEIDLIKRLHDGRYLFNKNGVYFTLTKEQADTIIKLIKSKEM